MALPGRDGRRPTLKLRAGSRIHAGLTGERQLIGTPYLDDPQLRQQYAAEIAPRTGAALAKILGELSPEAPRERRPRVLDLGAGTGAAGAAVAAYFAGHGENIELVSVDQVGTTPQTVLANLAATPIPPGVTGRFDLVVAAHLVNELYVGLPPEARLAARTRAVLAWCERLLEDGETPGTLILVEPALRETSRELLALRDRVVATGLHIVAPCFWVNPCPALVRDRDWCHDTVPAGRDRRAQPRVDFSYLVLRAHGETTSDQSVFRVVSDPIIEKGRLRLYGCGPAGRQPLIRLTRHRSDGNAAFDDLRRGDVAQVSRTTFARDGLRIGEETTVVRR